MKFLILPSGIFLSASLSASAIVSKFNMLVSLKVCDSELSQHGGSTTGFRLNFAFPNNPDISLESQEFARSVDDIGRWYTVYNGGFDTEFLTFTEGLTVGLSIDALGEDALCIEEIRVNGIEVEEAILPAFLDNPCGSKTYKGITCDSAWSGQVVVNPPTHPVEFTFATCDYEGSGTSDDYTLNFPSQEMFTTLDFTPQVGATNTMTLYLKNVDFEEDMEISSYTRDGWCLSEFSIANELMADEEVWLDNPCISNTEHVCATSVTYSFTMPTDIPVGAVMDEKCTEWKLGYSGESCTETCARIDKQCILFDIAKLNTLEKFKEVVGVATKMDETAVGTYETYCSVTNTWTQATAASAMEVTTRKPDETNPEVSVDVTEVNCFYPAEMVGDCSTKFLVPDSQRFCSCSSNVCE